MAIYDFSKTEKAELEFIEKKGVSTESETIGAKGKKPDLFFSAFAARLFFLLLLIGDLLWVGYALIRFSISLTGRILTANKVGYFNTLGEKAWISLRRSLVCAVSLFIALFNPAFGIMIACTYFLMYDKSGIEEVVPSSLQSQFKEFFPGEE